MDRSGAMYAIWGGVGIAGFGAAMFGASTGHSITDLFVVLMIGALLATILVWSDQLVKARQMVRTGRTKAKRSSEDKIALLRDVLDDDEWQQFKATLKRSVLAELETDLATSDGELPLAALLDERETAQERYG